MPPGRRAAPHGHATGGADAPGKGPHHLASERAQLAEARLNTLLGRPAGAAGRAALTLIVTAVPVTDAEQLALERHPQLALASAAIRREEAELARLRGDRRPDFVDRRRLHADAGRRRRLDGTRGPHLAQRAVVAGRLTAALDVQEKRLAAATAREVSRARRSARRSRSGRFGWRPRSGSAQLIESTVLPQIEHAFEVAQRRLRAG